MNLLWIRYKLIALIASSLSLIRWRPFHIRDPEVAEENNVESSQPLGTRIYQGTADVLSNMKSDAVKLGEEIRTECFSTSEVQESLQWFRDNYKNFIFVPYFPAFHSPGWLLRYVVGPHNRKLLEQFFYDFWAGVTVALTLIPQGLSYAQLANLPAINGLYTAVLTAAVYIFFGSSMQLCVGPVALVSLLTAQLINKYNIDYVNDPTTAVEFAGEAALAVGTILSIMSILNLGELIRFISHPVMSGFTTGAALIIGLNQIKSAFGFTVSVPQQGQPGYDYNYQVMSWFTSRWDLHYHFTAAQIKKKPSLGLQDGRSYQNHYAIRIFFGLYIPLLFIVILKNYFKPTPERRKSWVFHAWTIFANLMPFVAVIIGAHVAWKIKHDDGYNNPRISHDWFAKKLSIVGQVKSGLSFTGMPSLRWDFGTLLGDVVETALIAYMESYGVAQRCAKQNNEFHLLNANQEMFAISCANFLASVSHGYPVAGSFSRSSLNHLAGAKTPFSKVVNMFVVVIALGSLTKTFQYIPNAALAAIIWIAVFQLVSFSDMWDAWKHSKKDFFVMFATCVFVFILNTGVGLAIGIGISVLVHLLETSFSPINAPQVVETEEETINEIKYIRLKADLTFLTIGRTQDIVNAAIYVPPKAPDSENSTWNDRVFFKISNAFDQFFQPKLIRGTSVLPKVVAIDFAATSVIDLDAIHAVDDFSRAARSRGVAFFILNVHPTIAKTLVKFGYVNDDLTYFIDPIVAQRYHLLAGDIIPIVARLVTVLDKEKEKEEQYAVVATNEDESKKDVDAQENI